MIVDLGASGCDGIDQSGLLFITLQAVSVGCDTLETERINRGHGGIEFFKRFRINQALDAFAGSQIKVMLAFGADLEVFGQCQIMNHLAAGWTLCPKASWHFASLTTEGTENGFFKDSHGF